MNRCDDDGGDAGVRTQARQWCQGEGGTERKKVDTRRRRQSTIFTAPPGSPAAPVVGASEPRVRASSNEGGGDSCSGGAPWTVNKVHMSMAGNAWRMKAENSSLRQTVQQQQHEISCLSLALKVKKEQLFNTEAMLGEEKRKNMELSEKLVRFTDLLHHRFERIRVRTQKKQSCAGSNECERRGVAEYAERNDSSGVPNGNASTEHETFHDPEWEGDGIELDLNPDSALDESSLHETDDKPEEQPEPVLRKPRRSSIGPIDYIEPSLRSKLRKGFKHTFGADDSANKGSKN